MPTVKVFPSFKITMYFEDHGAPHVHIVAPEYEAKLDRRKQKYAVGALAGVFGVKTT